MGQILLSNKIRILFDQNGMLLLYFLQFSTPDRGLQDVGKSWKKFPKTNNGTHWELVSGKCSNGSSIYLYVPEARLRAGRISIMSSHKIVGME